jgi:hypothetical protein
MGRFSLSPAANAGLPTLRAVSWAELQGWSWKAQSAGAVGLAGIRHNRPYPGNRFCSRAGAQWENVLMDNAIGTMC